MSETRDTGIPTKAIHESYLALQQAHRDWRRARDFNGDERQQRIAFQDQVLTFYELLRPHLRHESGLRSYWQGEIPSYPDDPLPDVDAAVDYYATEGTAVWQLQRQPGDAPIPGGSQQTLTDGGLPETLAGWDDVLGLPDDARLLAIKPEPELGTAIYLAAMPVAGLKQLDNWGTRKITQTEDQSGFLGGQTVEREVREPMPAAWSEEAKRLLVEAADQMALLSEVDASATHTKIDEELFEEVEAWQQQQD